MSCASPEEGGKHFFCLKTAQGRSPADEPGGKKYDFREPDGFLIRIIYEPVFGAGRTGREIPFPTQTEETYFAQGR